MGSCLKIRGMQSYHIVLFSSIVLLLAFQPMKVKGKILNHDEG